MPDCVQLQLADLMSSILNHGHEDEKDPKQNKLSSSGLRVFADGLRASDVA
jgi:hypothetical protein